MLMCDFETTCAKQAKEENNTTRVWLACAIDVDTLVTKYLCTNIDSFMQFILNQIDDCYFHNLAFDGAFIVDYLMRNNWTYCSDLKSKTDHSFNTLISSEGQWYSITICVKAGTGKGKNKKGEHIVKIYDSLKKLPLSVEKIGKMFGQGVEKGKIDYNAFISQNHTPTDEEIDYIVRDCKVVALALQEKFKQGLNKMTQAGDALYNYKTMMLSKSKRQSKRKLTADDVFRATFPEIAPSFDDDIRLCYRGGFTYCNPQYQNKLLNTNVDVYDVNSLYPDVMYNRPLPYGTPVHYKGQYKQNKNYTLYIQHISVMFRLKQGFLPTVQLKHTSMFAPEKYIEDSGIIPIDMWVTNVDLDLMFAHYDIDYIEYIEGYMFKAKTGLFKDYIDYWIEEKKKNTGAKRQIAKLMLNSLYGKFATKTKPQSKRPYMNEEGIVKMTNEPPEQKEPVYTALACFVTAWARYKTITSIQKVGIAHFVYADTDSMHIIGISPEDVSKLIEVDDKNLGAWKHELHAINGKFLHAKCYVEQYEDDGALKYKVTCAGMPEAVKSKVNFDNFNFNARFDGKLLKKTIKGGVVLSETTFEIKERKDCIDKIDNIKYNENDDNNVDIK